MQLDHVRNDDFAQTSGRLHSHAPGEYVQRELSTSLVRAREVLEASMPAGGNDRLANSISWLTAGTEKSPGPQVLKYFTVLGCALSSLDFQLESKPQDPVLLEQRENLEQAVRRLGDAMGACKYPPAGGYDVGDGRATIALYKEYAKCEAAVSDCMKVLGIESQIEAVAQAVVAPLMLQAIAKRQPDMVDKAKAGQLSFDQLMNILEPGHVKSTNDKIATALSGDSFRGYWGAVQSLMKLPEYVETPDPGKAGPPVNTDRNADPPIPQNVLNHARDGGAPVLYNSVNVGETSQQAHGEKGADAQITKDVLTAFADNLMRFLTKGVELGQQRADISKFADISDQLNDIRNQCEDLQNRNNALLNKYHVLQKENDELQKDKDNLFDVNNALFTKNNELFTRNNELTGMVDDLNSALHLERLPVDDEGAITFENLPSASSVLRSPDLVRSVSDQVLNATASGDQPTANQTAVTSRVTVLDSRVVHAETATSSSSNPLGRVGQPNRFGKPVVQVSSLQQDSNLMPEGMVPERHVKMMSSFFEQRSSAQSSRQAVIGVESRHLGAASKIRESVGEDFSEWPRVKRKVDEFEQYNRAWPSGQYGVGGVPFNRGTSSARPESVVPSPHASRSVVGSSSPVSGFIGRAQSPELARDSPLPESEVITIGSKHALDQGKRLNEMRGMINPLEDVFSVKIASESAEPRSLRLDPLLSGDGENENIGEGRSNQSMTVFKSAGIGTSHDSGLDARSSDSGSSVEGEDATPDFRKDPSFNQQIINQLNGLKKVDLIARHPSGNGWLNKSIYGQ